MSEPKSKFFTGAAGEIGLASAERFAGEGWFVGLADPKLGRAPGS
jgi:NAD(P)-dependent dehydrogenase (short-subunit alcohol dehydrogenase family)